MDHEIGSLPTRLQLTTGKPAALSKSVLESGVLQHTKKLMRAKHAAFRRSSLHAFVDIYRRLRAGRHAVLVDAGAYPIQKWAIDMARGRGVSVRVFKHHEIDALVHHLLDSGASGQYPVVAADGYCAACGRLTPITKYLEAIRAYGGHLVVDDTQCTGILGEKPRRDSPWGTGGGGSHLYAGAHGDPNMTIVTSFAKGMAAPVAAVASETSRLLPSDTETHCSPATNADLSALGRALAINAVYGDELRRRLLKNILIFRHELKTTVGKASGGLFPVQSVNVAKTDAASIVDTLRAARIRPVTSQACSRTTVAVSLLITARHRPADVAFAARVLHAALSRGAERRHSDTGTLRALRHTN